MEKSLFYPLEVPSYCENTVAKVIKELYKIPRSGYKDRGILNCETVGEHIDRTILLAEKLFPGRLRLLIMLKIHDWMELITGDKRTDPLASKENRITKEKKKTMELEAMILICESLGAYGSELFDIWQEFEAQETWDAKTARQIDHAQSIFMSWEYEQAGEPVTGQEFYDYYKWEMVEPLIVEELARIGFN